MAGDDPENCKREPQGESTQEGCEPSRRNDAGHRLSPLLNEEGATELSQRKLSSEAGGEATSGTPKDDTADRRAGLRQRLQDRLARRLSGWRRP